MTEPVVSMENTDPIFIDEASARRFLEMIRWPDGPVCPFCDKQRTVKALQGKSMGDGWYHCRDCRKKFTVRVGTLYQRSHVPLHKWLLATHFLCTGNQETMTIELLQMMIGVSYKTAWSMMDRISEAARNDA